MVRLRSLFPICAALLVAGLSLASTADARTPAPYDDWGAIVVSADLRDYQLAPMLDLVAIAGREEIAEPELRPALQSDRQTFAKVNRAALDRGADRRVLLDNGLWRRPSG